MVLLRSRASALRRCPHARRRRHETGRSCRATVGVERSRGLVHALEQPGQLEPQLGGRPVRTGAAEHEDRLLEVAASQVERVFVQGDGFIRKLPHHLVASFRATLEETRDADLLLHVIDASSPTWEEQRVVVAQVLDELGVSDQPKLLVFNKIDLLDHDALFALQERIVALAPSSIFVSTVTEGGLEPLRRALSAAIRVRRPLTRILMSPSDGRLLAETTGKARCSSSEWKVTGCSSKRGSTKCSPDASDAPEQRLPTEKRRLVVAPL